MERNEITRKSEDQLSFGNLILYRNCQYTHQPQILLLKKDRGWPFGEGKTWWTVFGGHKETGETSLETAVREAKEELGLTITPDLLEWLTDIRAELKGEMKHAAQYIAEFTHLESDIRLGEGCGWGFWYEDEVATLPLLPHERPAIEQLFERIHIG